MKTIHGILSAIALEEQLEVAKAQVRFRFSSGRHSGRETLPSALSVGPIARASGGDGGHHQVSVLMREFRGAT